ncbi:hypothetical protein BUALT_Bualt01G0133600 [Buddleja alternifolia]|uniref:Uncharacterized protein n=1 Tax=Buddleja alternifolia TaxID=168488 RepID=A0AAV6YDT9_9LAMI|nr:hypothetical protein BUALT_Bualt01G0133600 [Buddleja alternifolia]
MLGNFKVGGNNDHTLEVLRWIINNQFQVDLSQLDVMRHVKKFQKRHRVFAWLVGMAGVLYDGATNTIIGLPFVWDHICTEQRFAYAYMSEEDPKWRELQIIFMDMTAQGEQKMLEHVIDIPSSDEEMDMIMAENYQNNLLPVIEGILFYELSSGDNDEEVLNAQVLPEIPLIVVSDDDIGSPDTQFWKEVFKGYASDTGSEEYENNTGLVFFPMHEEIVARSNFDEQAPLSPTSLINNSLTYISPSSSASNSPSYGS